MNGNIRLYCIIYILFAIPPEDTGSAGVGAVAGVARTQRQRMMLALCDMITDMGIVSFLPMNVEDGEVRLRSAFACACVRVCIACVSHVCRACVCMRWGGWGRFVCLRCYG